MITYITLLSCLMLVQETAGNRLGKAIERYERELRELEESMVELGPAGISAIKPLCDGAHGDVRAAAVRATARIEELKPRMEEWIRNLGAAAVELREEAHEGLRKAGRAAHAYLEDASRSPDKEVASRASDLLGRNKVSSEPPIHEVVMNQVPGARGEVVVKEAPPPPIVEVIANAAPSPNHVWVSGYWFWNGQSYVWIKGGWYPRPRGVTGWVAGHWEKRAEGSVWIGGYWR